jgi:hypothetical protein
MADWAGLWVFLGIFAVAVIFERPQPAYLVKIGRLLVGLTCYALVGAIVLGTIWALIHWPIPTAILLGTGSIARAIRHSRRQGA